MVDNNDIDLFMRFFAMSSDGQVAMDSWSG